MNAIRAMFETLGRPALLPFLTAGLPTPAASRSLFSAMSEAGADGFEVGIPYSDPLMDGPVIMRGSEAALAAGTNQETAMAILGEVADIGRPTLAMTYANPVMQTGWGPYSERLAAAGAAGIIVPDLPLEESVALRAAAADVGLGVVLFVSPMSDRARIEQVAAADPVFIYGVSDLGVTGERNDVSEHVLSLSARVREVTDVPLVLGVGISTPEQVAAVRTLADGVIVGSALVRRVLESSGPERAAAALHEAVKALRAALG
jgi:tryptophan synthase alpha chain